MTERPATPMLEKRSAIRDKAQVIGQFLEWLQGERDLTLCVPKPDHEGYWTGPWYIPARAPVEDLLNEYFEIDQKQVDREQDALLAWVRVEQGMTPEGGRA